MTKAKRKGNYRLTPTQAHAVFMRVRAGETKISLAKEFGVSRETIRRYARGPRDDDRLQPCGTNAAYARHLRNKEVACAKCLAAHAEAIRRHKHKDDDRELTQKAYLSSRKKPDGQIKPASLKRREQRARKKAA